MTRVRKTLLVASTLLALVTLGLYVQSYFTILQITLAADPPRFWCLISNRGSVTLEIQVFPDSSANPQTPYVESSILGFRFISTYYFTAPRKANGSWTYGSMRKYCAPYWSAVLLVGLPAIGLLPTLARARRRRRRAQTGCCIECGYDLTGNQSCVCPECGERTQRTIEWAPT